MVSAQLSDAEAVIGMAAKRPLREGSVVAMRDIVAQQVIKAGDLLFTLAESQQRALVEAADARVTAARTDVNNLMQALKLYRLDNQRYPTAAQGLQALITKPAVKVAESAMIKIVCPIAKAIINHQDWPVDDASATPNAALDSMTIQIHF